MTTSSTTSPRELQTLLRSGLLSFPLTDFDTAGDFDPVGYTRRLEWLAPYGASALFAAGGTGEFFSLVAHEYEAVVRTAVEVCRGQVPIIAGAGGPTRQAVAYARRAQALGAHGILLLPHYLTEAPPEGVMAHVHAVCDAVDIGVIVYNRALCRLGPAQLEELAGRCANLVGFKDGIGDIELMVSIRQRLGDRLTYLGGLPTAEVYAAAYKAIGVPVYSSAVFNFAPATALAFCRAVAEDDHATQSRLLDEFFLPYLAIRNRRAGYAVSIVKAGAALVGRSAGPVRPPLIELTSAEREELAALLARLGPQS